MPDAFCEAPNGFVYDFNGIDRPVRWDGITTDVERAGIDGPTTAISLGYDGAGPIIGSFYAYARFMDADGNFSNVSPISNEAEPLVEVGNGIAGASNASPIVITTNAAHGLSTGQIVKVAGCYGNTAANDFWRVTVLTATTFSLDDSTANGSYNSGGHVYTGAQKIIYQNVPVSTDPKVTKRQILRNQDGDLETFYVDIETEDLASTTFESTATSADLAGADEVPITDMARTDLAIEYHSPPPDDMATCVVQGGRLFAAVPEFYAEGCVVVTAGSRTVTGIGVEWNMQTFGGRFLTVRGETRTYEIESVQSVTSLTLVDAYEGTTDPYARYVIAPNPERRRAIAWSAATLYESFPPVNIRQLPEDTGAGNLTGQLAQQSFLYLLAEYWTYRFGWFKNPNLDGGFTLAANRGCVNHRCCVSVGSVAYMLDYLGVHAFAGNDDAPMSDMISDLFRPLPNTDYRINWRASKYFHGCHDPGEGVIRFFVALDGNYTPRHALVLNPKRKRWCIERWPYPIGASALGKIAGRPQVLYGTLAGRVLAPNQGTLDGPDPLQGTVMGTVTSAGPGWIADSSASFASSGIVGFPVSITEGTGRGQQRIAYAVSGTVISVRPCWQVRPDTTSVYQIGGVEWVWRSGWFGWQDSPSIVRREMKLFFKRQQYASGFSVRLYDDTQDEPLESLETKTRDSGDGVGSERGSAYLDIDPIVQPENVKIGMAGYRDSESNVSDYGGVELRGVQNRDRVTVWGLDIEGAKQT